MDPPVRAGGTAAFTLQLGAGVDAPAPAWLVSTSTEMSAIPATILTTRRTIHPRTQTRLRLYPARSGRPRPCPPTGAVGGQGSPYPLARWEKLGQSRRSIW